MNEFLFCYYSSVRQILSLSFYKIENKHGKSFFFFSFHQHNWEKKATYEQRCCETRRESCFRGHRDQTNEEATSNLSKEQDLDSLICHTEFFLIKSIKVARSKNFEGRVMHFWRTGCRFARFDGQFEEIFEG